MDKTAQEMVHEINELLGNVPNQHIHEFDIRDLTPSELALIYRIAHKVAIRKQYMQARGLSSIDDIPLDDRYLFS